MQTKQLGGSNQVIPVIGQGCGVNYPLTLDERLRISKIIREGVDLGMTLLDTAEVYGAGTSEEMVGLATTGIRDKVFIATKVSPQNLSYHGVISSAEKSLRRLRSDYIDLYQIHWPNPTVPLEETIAGFQKLIETGKIRYFGVSNFLLKDIIEIRKLTGSENIVSNQFEYNLLDRSVELEVLPYCQNNSISVIAYSPQARNKITLENSTGQKLMLIAEEYNCTLSQIILAWLTATQGVTVVTKSFNRNNIQLNAKAGDICINKEHYDQISMLFMQYLISIDPALIKVVQISEENRRFYETLDEALSNPCGYSPSPLELARSLEMGDKLKPIKIILSSNKEESNEYYLVEGQVRYWAHLIAFGRTKPILAIKRGY